MAKHHAASQGTDQGGGGGGAGGDPCHVSNLTWPASRRRRWRGPNPGYGRRVRVRACPPALGGLPGVTSAGVPRTHARTPAR
eukprot:scaffold2585_cov368-Prasinococcus_capsulatus_cf.AAC.1